MLLAAFGNLRGVGAQNGPNKAHSVSLQWDRSVPPASGYFVYRISGANQRVKLTKKKITETQYTDKSVTAGQTYTYYVTAVNSKGGESAASAPVTVTIPGN